MKALHRARFSPSAKSQTGQVQFLPQENSFEKEKNIL